MMSLRTFDCPSLTIGGAGIPNRTWTSVSIGCVLSRTQWVRFDVIWIVVESKCRLLVASLSMCHGSNIHIYNNPYTYLEVPSLIDERVSFEAIDS